jgi:perosamine synthetase
VIPRFKPDLGSEEMRAALHWNDDAVSRFEKEFSSVFEARHGLAFAYGRSALWALFKALGIDGAEIIMPAYTCTVVANAVILSGNTPRFVDITLYDYNMDLARAAAAINQRTRAIIATHLFGYPLDVDALGDIVHAAEQRVGHKIWVIHDCAHAFGARWRGRLVCREGDAALFGLNVSKVMTSVFGGMMTTSDGALYQTLRRFRDEHCREPGPPKTLRRLLYLMAAYLAFDEHMYGLVDWLQERTPLLNYVTRAYHLDEKIHFPPDYLDRMLALEARVGLVQLRKYLDLVRRREENARFYLGSLPTLPGWTLPPLVDGATYSHFPVRVLDRARVVKGLRTGGVQAGQLIDYSLPHMAAYAHYAEGEDFPNSRLCSQQMVNLPVHAGLGADQCQRIADTVTCLWKRPNN